MQAERQVSRVSLVTFQQGDPCGGARGNQPGYLLRRLGNGEKFAGLDYLGSSLVVGCLKCFHPLHAIGGQRQAVIRHFKDLFLMKDDNRG